jgi:hypothetical protein
MSFEGYYRRLCIAGHITICDIYENPSMKCPEWHNGYCGEEFVFEEIVDETNGEGEKTYFEPISSKGAECRDCGSYNIDYSPAVYKVPQKYVDSPKVLAKDVRDGDE